MTHLSLLFNLFTRLLAAASFTRLKCSIMSLPSGPGSPTWPLETRHRPGKTGPAIPSASVAAPVIAARSRVAVVTIPITLAALLRLGRKAKHSYRFCRTGLEWAGDLICRALQTDHPQMGTVATREEPRSRHIPIPPLGASQKSSMLHKRWQLV